MARVVLPYTPLRGLVPTPHDSRVFTGAEGLHEARRCCARSSPGLGYVRAEPGISSVSRQVARSGDQERRVP